MKKATIFAALLAITILLLNTPHWQGGEHCPKTHVLKYNHKMKCCPACSEAAILAP